MLDLVALPKAELHLHLEGAIPPESLLALLRKYGASDCQTLEALRARLVYRDFPHFLGTWQWMTRYVREYDDFRAIAAGVAQDLAAQGIVYAEVFFSPPDFFQHGLRIAGIALAIREGLARAAAPVTVRLICDLCRQHPPELSALWLEEVAAVSAEAGIIGVGLGGPEHTSPPEPFVPVYRRAAELGLRRVVHAGEAAGPESVRGALDALGAERIGHGTRAIEDPELVRRLVAQRIPVEVCPTSNVRTGVVERLEKHPVRQFCDAGVLVTLASDDPTFFGANLVDEYTNLRTLGFRDEELVRIARAGFEAAFLSDAERAHWLQAIDGAREDALGPATPKDDIVSR
jgi:adenosine deaminase